MDTWRRLSPSHAVAVPRRRTLLAIALCAIVAVGALVLSRTWNAPRGNGPCADLDLHEGRLERAEPLGLPDGEGGNVWLCLAYAPEQALYGALLTPINTVEELHTAKALAADRLQASGFDPCLIGMWGSPSASVPQTLDNLLDSPIACPPHVVAADPGAEQWLPNVRAAAMRVADASSRDFDWQPARNLTILVVADAETAMATYKRYGPTGPPEAVARWAASGVHLMQAGTSWFEAVSGTGSMIVLNLNLGFRQRWDPSPEAMRAAIDGTLAHEYTHFAQHTILGNGSVPAWFMEGQAEMWAGQLVGGTYERLPVFREPNSTPPRLAELASGMDWASHDRLDPATDPHAQGYGALAYLADRYGFPATVQLLRDNRDGDLEHFQELLVALTGMNVDALDDAVGAWMSQPGRVILRDDFSVPSGHWPGGEYERGKYGYEGGAYAVRRRFASGGDAMAFAVLPPGEFEAEIDARLVPPTDGGVLRFQAILPNYAGRYVFDVDPTRQAYAIGLDIGPERKPVIAWTPTPAIHRGTAPNRLRLRATRSEIIVWA
jgi:hypothetical protein